MQPAQTRLLLVDFGQNNLPFHDCYVQARRIGQNGQRFAKEMLNKQALRCYWLTLFQEYTKLLRYNPADVKRDTWINVSEYLAEFRANKPGYSDEWYNHAMSKHPGAYEFEDAFGVPES